MRDNEEKKMLVLLFTTLVLALTSAEEVKSKFTHPLSEEFQNYINDVQDAWTAGRNFHPDTSKDYIKKLLGVIKNDNEKLPVKYHVSEDDEELPETFDSRKKWPYCKSINEIRDQGRCASSWAVSAVSVMTDRVCIFSKGKVEHHLSAFDLMSCCETCTTGCEGGSLYQAWDYYKSSGIVSGGNYNSSTGCRPYPFRNCNHDQAGNNSYPNCDDVNDTINITCERKCIAKGLNYDIDQQTALSVYTLDYGEKQIKKEIIEYGPVQATFDVYEDFLSYKKGVYMKTTGDLLGSHAVKIIGWGVENSRKYWLVANSWNEYWGDNGFFKIIRGSDYCNIEDDIYAGMPLITH